MFWDYSFETKQPKLILLIKARFLVLYSLQFISEVLNAKCKSGKIGMD